MTRYEINITKVIFYFFAELELKNFLYVKILFLFAIFAGSDAGSIPITFRFFLEKLLNMYHH